MINLYLARGENFVSTQLSPRFQPIRIKSKWQPRPKSSRPRSSPTLSPPHRAPCGAAQARCHAIRSFPRDAIHRPYRAPRSPAASIMGAGDAIRACSSRPAWAPASTSRRPVRRRRSAASDPSSWS